MAFRKFPMDTDFQEKIIEAIKNVDELCVTEKVHSYTWQRIDNYVKTVSICAK